MADTTLKVHSENLFGTVDLRRSEKFNYSIETLLSNTIRQVERNGIQRISYSQERDLTFDMKRYYYWVQITTTKSRPEGDIAVHGVELALQ